MKHLDSRIFSINRSRFTEQQIAFALQQAEQSPAAGEVTRKMGMGDSPII
ncbi:MAG: hypothetical protein ACYDIC_14625 [Desulfobaccales bacterium]